jgi:Holliday junction DNA helicase RuvA
MFEYIKGELKEKNPSFTIIENNNIGYFVNISLNTFSKIETLNESKIYIHQIIREDSNSLFGFFDKGEREIFRLLISVSGIGANTARIMLSSLSPEEIKNAIQTENVNLIKSIKGIGIKTAQRVIIDLKDKISKTEVEAGEIFTISNPYKDEALSALVMLGFAKKPAEKIIDKIITDNPGINIEAIVKLALKAL